MKYICGIIAGLLVLTLVRGMLCESLIPADNKHIVKNLKYHVKYLSSPELGGRIPATRGDTLAAEYIVSRYSSLGLIPAFDGSYRQYFRILQSIEEGVNSSFDITISSGSTISLERNIDFVGDYMSGSGLARGGGAFIGYGIYAPDKGYDDYSALDLDGKVAFCFLVASKDKTKEHIRKLAVSNRYTEKVSIAQMAGAAAFVFVMPEKYTSFESSMGKYRNRIPNQRSSQQSIPVLRITFSAFNRFLYIAGINTEDVVRKLGSASSSQAFLLPGISMNIRCDMNYKYRFTSNIGGLIKAENSEETIIIGAHYDHIGQDKCGNPRYGANDNASGVAVMLEMASLLAEITPKCNYLFIAFGMEEWGCIGSQHFLHNLPCDRNLIKAVINLDMIGNMKNDTLQIFHSQSAKEWPENIYFANNAALHFVFKPNRSASDSDIFARAGIPTLFLYTGVGATEDYSNEHLSLNYNGMEKILNFAYDLVLKISNPDIQMNYHDINIR
jgi:hypothetical protein